MSLRNTSDNNVKRTDEVQDRVLDSKTNVINDEISQHRIGFENTKMDEQRFNDTHKMDRRDPLSADDNHDTHIMVPQDKLLADGNDNTQTVDKKVDQRSSNGECLVDLPQAQDAEWQEVTNNTGYVYSAHLDTRHNRSLIMVFGFWRYDDYAYNNLTLFCHVWRKGKLVTVIQAHLKNAECRQFM